MLKNTFFLVKHGVPGSWDFRRICNILSWRALFPRKIRGSGLLGPLGNFLGRSPLPDPSSGPPLGADFGPFWSENLVKYEVFKKSEAGTLVKYEVFEGSRAGNHVKYKASGASEAGNFVKYEGLGQFLDYFGCHLGCHFGVVRRVLVDVVGCCS